MCWRQATWRNLADKKTSTPLLDSYCWIRIFADILDAR